MTELLIGDPAPGLMLGEFLKGEPVAELVRGNVYVIEFWSSSCGPCRTSIPHLTELQKKYPQVTIIGVTPQADTQAARTLVAEMGDQIDYRIALDRLLTDDADEGAVWWTNRWMARHWLMASYKLGVPCAFIVDAANRVAWIGYPTETETLETPLAKVVDGTWDLPAAAQSYKEALIESKEREQFRLQMEVLKARGGAAIVAAIDKGIAAEPALEKMFRYMFVIQKLRALMHDKTLKPAAMPYAKYLINDVCHEDMQALLALSSYLFRPNKMQAQGEGFERETDFLDLALQALHRIDELRGKQPQPDTFTPAELMRFDSHFARALLAAGKIDDARDHALRAFQWGNESGASDEDMRQLEKLVSDCRRGIQSAACGS